MAQRVRAGSFYYFTGHGLFESILGNLKDGELVQVVNVHLGRNRGPLRHVKQADGTISLCNIHLLEPAGFSR